MGLTTKEERVSRFRKIAWPRRELGKAEVNGRASGGGKESEDSHQALEYRIVDEGIVVVTLRANRILTEPGRLLYRRGAVRWSRGTTGRNVLG